MNEQEEEEAARYDNEEKEEKVSAERRNEVKDIKMKLIKIYFYSKKREEVTQCDQIGDF